MRHFFVPGGRRGGTFNFMRRLFMTAVLVALSSSCGRADGPTSYVPDAPIAYDGRYLAGSFEQQQGNFWDVCFTRTPELLRHMFDGGSDGSAYMMLESGGCFTGCMPNNASLSLFDIWFVGAPSVSAMGVYFDAKNVAGTAPTGSLHFYGTGSVCAQETLLADAPLDRLELIDAWSTRCVTVSGLAAYHGIGIAVTGGSHVIARQPSVVATRKQ